MQKHLKRQDLVCLACLFAASLFWLWRIQFGHAQYDESFYLTIPYRLSRGDTLLIDEWHLSQLSGFLLWPLMALYRLCAPGCGHIVLAFRLIWVFFHQLTALLVYLLLRRHSPNAAACSCLIFSLFVPFNVMSLSYNSMGQGAALLLVILFAEGYDGPGFMAAKGFLLAVLVLCNPYCLFLYPIILLYLLLGQQVQQAGAHRPIFQLAWFHLGIALLLVPFLTHIARGAQSFSQLLGCLRALMYDPEHLSTPILPNYLSRWESIVGYYPLFTLAYCFFLLAGWLSPEKRPFCFSVICLLCGIAALYTALYDNHINFLAFFPAFAAWAAFLFFKSRRPGQLFWYGLVPFLYSVCLCKSSNQGGLVIADALLVTACLFPVVAGDFLAENGLLTFQRPLGAAKKRLLVLLAVAVCLLLQFVSMVQLLCTYFHSEGGISEMPAVMQDGPLAGLRTTENKANFYHQMLAALKAAGPSPEDSVMIAPVLPYGYFVLNSEIAAPSAWTSAREMNEPKIANYFALNPSKWPDWVIIPVEEIGENVREVEEFMDFFEQNGYSLVSSDELLIVLRAAL